jgi:hypothetical protein
MEEFGECHRMSVGRRDEVPVKALSDGARSLNLWSLTRNVTGGY